METVYCKNCDETFDVEELNEYRGEPIPEWELEAENFMCDHCKDDICITDAILWA